MIKFFIFTLCLFIVIFLVTKNVAAENTSITWLKILITEQCDTPPCLWDKSVNGMTDSEFTKMLEASPFVDRRTIIYPTRGNHSWRWFASPAMARQLNAPSIQSNLNWNFPFHFYNDARIHTSILLSFRFDLATIITVYGEPYLSIPHTYDRTGGMYYELHFTGVQGYFLAITRCDTPQLYADTDVVAHISTNRPMVSPEVSPHITWEGYTDDLPNCTIFQP